MGVLNIVKAFLYPAAALGFGAVGFALHRWQLATCFDESGLFTFGPAAIALIILTVLAVAVLLCMGVAHRWPPQDLPAILSQHHRAASLLRLTALPYLAAAGLLAWQIQNGSSTVSSVVTAVSTILPPLLVALYLLSAVSALVFPSWTGRGITALSPLVLFLTNCATLIYVYQLHDNDPVQMAYAWMILAGIVSLLAWLYTCSLAYHQPPKCKKALVWSMLAVALCLTNLADTSHWFVISVMLAQVWWFSIQTYLIAKTCR